MTPWVCAACASRAEAPGECCGEARLDARDERVRDLLRDIDLRAELRREGRVRALAVGVGLVTVFGAWLIPGWWTLRQGYALPFFADQWLLMIVIALGVMKLFGHAPRRFAFVDE